ncbi:EF-hand calcium-binding domain-containing protein 10 isoform X2 [Patagioenas fasciata]|uniref:EF-hand calcium-binding domain-containing protein 10 isoform X2 n=1 Tax=Patagioenas fasciata TaxID=372321 RepID=UPI003A99C452
MAAQPSGVSATPPKFTPCVAFPEGFSPPPERPREFLIQVLERVKAGKRDVGEYPYLMDEGNLAAMFSLLDVVGQGHITAAQYREALKTLGLSTEDLQFGDDVNITLDVFKEEVKKKMLASWAVY